MFSNIKIYVNKNSKGPKANGSVLIKDLVKVRFSVMNGPTGLFASLPSHKGNDGKYYSDVFIEDKDAYAAFQKAVVEAYNNAVGTSGGESQVRNDESYSQASSNVDDDDSMPF